jgi:hypothetical protein
MDKEALELLRRIAESLSRIETLIVKADPLMEHAQKMLSMTPAQKVKSLMSKNGESRLKS